MARAEAIILVVVLVWLALPIVVLGIPLRYFVKCVANPVILPFVAGIGMIINHNLLHANVSHFSDSDYALTEASLLGIPSTVDDPLWYPDNGATHHVTKDPIVYSSKQPYHGTKTVKMGKGSGLFTANIGSTYFSSPSTHKNVVLKNLLHVPLFTKNY